MPEGWTVQRDPHGRTYFVDQRTGEMTRSHPADAEWRHRFVVAKWGGMDNGEYLVLLIEHVKSRHIIDCISDAPVAELVSSSQIIHRLDVDTTGSVSLHNFVRAMNALSEKDGKPRVKDTRLLAMFAVGAKRSAASAFGRGSSAVQRGSVST